MMRLEGCGVCGDVRGNRGKRLNGGEGVKGRTASQATGEARASSGEVYTWEEALVGCTLGGPWHTRTSCPGG